MEKAQNTQCFACPGANAPFMLIIDATSVKGKKTVAATVNASKLLLFAIPTRLSSTEMRAVRRFMFLATRSAFLWRRLATNSKSFSRVSTIFATASDSSAVDDLSQNFRPCTRKRLTGPELTSHTT